MFPNLASASASPYPWLECRGDGDIEGEEDAAVATRDTNSLPQAPLTKEREMA